MYSSNERRAKLLGMPWGTANGRLRKSILFSLLHKHNENNCYRCGLVIERVEDLSIEHKLPWENVSVSLYWDIENIAFSHLKCNVPHRQNGGAAYRRKIGPEGTAWCQKCQRFKLIAKFQKNIAKWNGVQNWCADCMQTRER